MSEREVIAGEASQELEPANRTHPALKELAKLTVVRQLGLMLGLALSVAIGIAVVLWSQEPTYDVLFNGLNEADSGEILEALKSSKIEYKIDNSTGAIMVAPEKVRELKLKLAAQGLPHAPVGGYDLLDKEQTLGTSKNIEQMRFQRALEGEIARTITTIEGVKSARVLLALPKQSVFVREHKKPSASVIINLSQGRALNKGQIDSIVHLVASSVPLMEPEQVTVVDQRGQFLNNNDSSESTLSIKQFEYKQKIENHLIERIGNILSPVVGMDGLSAQVSADLDFTTTEKTQEIFNPDLPALRSEQTNEAKNALSSVQGVPGALSNQPPDAGIAPEIAKPDGSKTTQPTSENKSSTRNYELDKTITHVRQASGELRRLSVAVVVDNMHMVQDGKDLSQAYSQEDINRFTDLVKQAVGFDASRGDQVTVTNSAFKVIDEQPMAELPLWKEAWFLDAMKQLAAALVVLLIVFGVLRPTMRGLVARSEEEQKAIALREAQAQAAAIGGVVKYDEKGNPIAVPVAEPVMGESGTVEGENLALTHANDDMLLLEAPQSYEKRLEYVRKLVDDDPKLVSQVIKNWIKDDVK